MKPKAITAAFVRKNLPKRTKTSNKIHGGKLVIVAGSNGMYGAGLLAALAATRIGAGYTYLMLEWTSKQLLQHPDILFLKPKINLFKNINATAYIVGPGMGISTKAKAKLYYFIKRKLSNVVLDADGLTLLSKIKNPVIPHNWVLTPHEGELARLLNISADEVRKNPIHCIALAQKKYGCTILLKGADTYITDGKKLWISSSGTPALAKAGTGDVLAGIIGGLLSQGLEAATAAALGAYLHGLTSKRYLTNGNDVLSLRPLDLIDELPKTLKLARH
ncbi:MAG: NAD(P)H-hydrate dehydratase [Bdellovibrio sp. 28-41-41]|nr:MAG: NAD(P)H-hydrate dehydratase [Bdellovibrio sp. 28-41-41]